MSRILVLVVVSLLALIEIDAQQIAVESCNLSMQDPTATTYPNVDLNGDLTAAVKIFYSSGSDLDFRGNIVGEVVKRDGYYLIYLVDKTRRLHIYKDGMMPLEIDFTQYPDTPKGVLSGKTYWVKLKNIRVPKKGYGKGSNTVIFKSDVPLSELIVDGQAWSVNGTTAKRLIPYGEYEYQATSIYHQTIKGTIEVIKTLGSKVVNIKFND